VPGNDCLLGIDVGGTAVKIGLFDLEGHLVALHNEPIPFDSPRPGWAEVDPRRWLEAVPAGVRYVLDTGNVASEQVAGIGLSNMIGTVAPLDAGGKALRPAITYFDTRSAGEAQWILERAPRISELTGNRIVPGNTSLASVLWIREHEPEVYARTETFGQTNTILFQWLTGERRADLTNASFFGLYDFRRLAWSVDLAEKVGIDLEHLAPVEASASTAPLTRQTADLLGLPVGVPVAIGGLDGAMASVGAGAVSEGDAFDVCGTSEFIAVCLPEPVMSPELLARWHVVPGLWVLIGAISTPGAALQWFRDKLFAPGSSENSQALYAAMTAEARAAGPGANGVVFLPHMMGERAPIWDPHARGVFFGLSLSSTRGDMLRAVMEGAAYAMRHLIELIEERGGVPIRRVVMMGGPAQNPLWRQIKADVWGVELEISAVQEASVLGAALTAGVGAGVYSDYRDAVERAVPLSREIVTPSSERLAAYEHAYRVYRQLYPALAPTMHLAAET